MSHPEQASIHFAFCQDLSTLFPSLSFPMAEYACSYPIPQLFILLLVFSRHLMCCSIHPAHYLCFSDGKQCSGYMAHGMTSRHRRISARKRKSLLSHKGERVAIIIILIARRQPHQLVMVVAGAVVQDPVWIMQHARRHARGEAKDLPGMRSTRASLLYFPVASMDLF